MNERILHIEKLRAFSIALVFLFHLQVAGFQNGFLGVDIFFVISGFLMAKLYGDISSKADLLDYFRRRMARILPAYYATILLTVCVSFFLLLPHEIQMVMEQSLWAAFFLPNIGYWTDTSYFDHTNLRPLLNLWSLGVEIQFYLLFPFILFVARRSGALLLLLAVGSCLEYALLTRVDPESAFYLLPGRLWEFLAGYYAAQFLGSEIRQRIPRPQLTGTLAVIAIALLLILLPSVSRDYTFSATLLVVLLTTVAIVCGFSTGDEDSAFSRVLVQIGKYSYSIYLIHFPVIIFVMYSPFGGTDLNSDSVFATALAVLLTAVLSTLSYRFVELRTRRSLTGRQLTAAAFLFAVATVTVARPIAALSEQLVDPRLWNMSNALNDKDEFRCAASQESPRSSEDSCRIGAFLDAAAPQILLVGDSHGDALKQPLADYLASLNIGLRLMAENKAVAADYPVAKLIAEAQRFAIPLLVVHSIDNEVRPAALQELAIAAAEAGMSVAYIDSVPKYAFNVPAKLLADYRSNHALTLWAEPVSEIDFEQELTALAQRFDNFYRFPTSQYFCSAQCRVSDEAGRPYYYDSNHLTHTGVALLLPVFAEIGRLLEQE